MNSRGVLGSSSLLLLDFGVDLLAVREEEKRRETRRSANTARFRRDCRGNEDLERLTREHDELRVLHEV